MWRWTVRLPTRMPSLSSSPRIRSAPHSRFSAASRWIAATVSADTCGRLDAPRDLARQTRRNALPVPAQQRVRLHDEQRGAPAADQARQEDEAEAVGGGEHGPLDLAAEDHELLAQEGVLGDQLALVLTRSPSDPSAAYRSTG